LEHFEDTINLYERLFRIEPETVACDLHPEYLSTKYAVELTDARQSLRLVHVQHHHAHLASCLVDNGVDEDAIGVVFDGSGYGSDGAIWGGEFLVGGLRAFKRVGHLEYVRMPGGAAAIKKPYRMALSYLHTFCRQVQEKEALTGRIASPPPAANSNTFDSLDLKYLPLFAEVDPAEIMAVGRQLELGFNSPLTSSAGRLFDAVSALAGVRGTIDYEAQAAIELEMVAPDEVSVAEMKPYPFLIAVEEGCRVVKLGQLVRAVLADVGSRKGAALVSARFHRTVADVIVEMCQAIARETGIKVVVLTGGVFQNRLLFGLVTRSLGKHGFRVLSHRLVPCNDGGISLGQAVIAHFVAS
ncbi:MAG: carbamoyltransferase HypF, partial [Chloroflexi bacterium]|nr:carbamoyltransferase HypF [Chloroflexota bacterium]